MRVVTYNIQAGVRGVEWVAGVVRDLGPDVACLNETRRRHVRSITRVAGGKAYRDSLVRWRGTGNVILTRRPASVVVRASLSRSPGLERRSLLAVRVGQVTVATTHLGLVGEERLRHAREILDLLPDDGPLILAGDLNEDPDGPALALLLQRFTDAFSAAGSGSGETFPSSGPRHRIDYVLTAGLPVTGCSVTEALAADHRPVVAELRV